MVGGGLGTTVQVTVAHCICDGVIYRATVAPDSQVVTVESRDAGGTYEVQGRMQIGQMGSQKHPRAALVLSMLKGLLLDSREPSQSTSV